MASSAFVNTARASRGTGLAMGMQCARARARAGAAAAPQPIAPRRTAAPSGSAGLAMQAGPAGPSWWRGPSSSSRASSSRQQQQQQQAQQQQPQQQQRFFHASAPAQHGGIHRPEPGTGIKVTFRDAKGDDLKTVEANEGDDLLSVAHEYDVDLEGACEGSIACSTCHVILEPDVYDSLEEPGDDENDMLDLAFGLTDTSRLGCQVKIAKEQDGMVVQLPSATRNMRVDGSKPSH